MNKVFILAFALVLLSSCATEEDFVIDERPLQLIDAPVYSNDYTEFDENVRREVYRLYGEKVRLNEDWLFANVVGFKKLDKDMYQADVVVFLEEEVKQFTYVLKVDENYLVIEEKGVDEKMLEFSNMKVIDSIEEKSLRAEVRKRLVAVDFYTVDDLSISGYLGKYDLVVVDGGEEKLVESSFDPLGTNIPFELLRFEAEGRYLEYFIHDIGKLYDIYDIEAEERAMIELPGFYDVGYWHEDKQFVCTSGGDYQPAALVVSAGKWKLNDHEYIWPEDISENVLEDLYDNGLWSEALACEDLFIKWKKSL